MATTTYDRETFRMEASTRGVPPAHGEPPKPQSQMPTSGPGQQPKPAAKGANGKPGTRSAWGNIDQDKINALSTNYSVAPGMAWIELINVKALGAGQIKGDIPIWGSGQLLGALQLPIACVVIKPTVPVDELQGILPQAAGTKVETAGDDKPQEKSQQDKPQNDKDKPKKAGAQARDSEPNPEEETEEQALIRAELAGMAAETQGRHIVDDDLRAQYSTAIADEVTTIRQDQPRRLTPEEQAFTGMSPQGFPGLLPGLRNASALPSGLGVQGVSIDTSQTPAEVTVTLVGSGQVPAFSRWLIFTVTGV